MNAVWESHYAGLPAEGGTVSRCFMALEGVAWTGKRVLDVGCRRGKGVFKLSEQVGADGYVVGVDWRSDFVDAARAAAPAALQRSGLPDSNMEFRVAFPEDLAVAGLADASFDVVYLNNVCVLFADPLQALRECARVLVPSGLLVMEAPVAAQNPTEADLAAAYAEGDSLKAARPLQQLESWLSDAGFYRLGANARDFPSGDREAQTVILHAEKAN
ncbi:methyltransferase domain-containing protein [Adlercreutzia sp. R21]|uniref:class I SAM-dependent methyltransferase n=1 Tax=Adlercreutzia wanghongyangiae TaxID=3111451 RepID=UPI002DBA57C7|nr:methyltransferase domain-containing protein [Adlercreutzia sp. R21]MEC4184444.1 methyltransferase domain-containing protein [Adlercreutzia sp. R21]